MPGDLQDPPRPPGPAVIPEAPPPTSWRLLLLLMLLDAVVVFPTLGAKTLWHIDESRLAQIAREMVTTGDYLVPRIGGEVYACYPPLAYWAIAGSGSVFGWNEWAMRLPGALAGVLLAGLCGWLAWRLTASRLAAAAAAVALATTSGFVAQQATGRADTLVALFAMAAILVLDVITREGSTPRRLVAFYACVALGVLTKGPLAIVLPGVVAGCWILARRRWDWIRSLQPWWGVPAVLLLVVPWYLVLTQAGGGEALKENLLTENVEAFVSGHSHPQPIYYYLVRLPVRALPWILVLLALPWLPRVRKQGMFALVGALGIFLFLSMSTSKRLNYLTYLYPMLAVAEGMAAAALLEEARVRRVAAWGAVALAAAAALGTASLFLPSLWTAEVVKVARQPLVVAGAAGTAAFVAIAVLLRRDRPAASLGALGVVLSVMILFQGFVLEPRLDAEGRRGKAFCLGLGGLVPAGETIGAVGKETKAFFYFYIPRPMIKVETREAFLVGPLRYGFSADADRPDGAVVLATFQDKDPEDPAQVLWRRP
jgi:4-amino-4-deoxy-L-arabinose transferase-like glycosyltransferase